MEVLNVGDAAGIDAARDDAAVAAEAGSATECNVATEWTREDLEVVAKGFFNGEIV